MRIVQPTRVSLFETTAHTLNFQGSRGESFCVTVLDNDLIRVQHMPDGRSRLDRTWMIVGKNGQAPVEGRQRAEIEHFARPAFETTASSSDVTVVTDQLHVTIQLDRFALQWATRERVQFAADLAGRAYPYDVADSAVYHYLECQPDEYYYGFGERCGHLNKEGASFRLFNLDTFGYDAIRSDPLYKHYPFYITYNAQHNIAYGLFYDNLATTIFDLGKEIDNYYPRYRKYMAEGGDIDYYLIYGPTIEQVLEKLSHLTGAMLLPPRWSLGYLGSTMSYTDAPDAQQQLKRFVELCQQHEIPCDLFHLSSGYTSGEDGKRYVFNWNEEKIPEPKQMVASFHDAGIRLAANIKPCLLTTHPRFTEVAELEGFISEASSSEPRLEKFWGGYGAHLDFTHPATYAWWKARVLDSLLSYGIDGTWNDNNEYPLEDDEAVCHGFGDPISVGLIRPLLPLLMTRASYEAQREHRPHERPYLITRSGCPGIHRYAQTWSGDNRTSWDTLRYNIPMGLGLGLSGTANFGHDVGGFAGGKPDAELFVRWVQNGIFHPRFTIHSWNDDGTVNEPWMHLDVLPIVRETIRFRYRLLPYLYSLFFEAAATGHPIVRPMVYHFSHDPRSHEESFDFMLGPFLLVASVVEAGARSRSVYLPQGVDWCDFYTGRWHTGGQTIELDAPLERAPLLVRAGGIIPMGKPMRFVGEQPDDVRQILLFPGTNGDLGRFDLIEDDGVSMAYLQGNYCQLHIQMAADAHSVRLEINAEGSYRPAYTAVEFILPPGDERSLQADRIQRSWVDTQQRRHITVQYG